MTPEMDSLLRDVQMELLRLHGNRALIDRVAAALASDLVYAPPGLTREEKRQLILDSAKVGTPAPGPRPCNECTHPNSCELLEFCMFQK